MEVRDRIREKLLELGAESVRAYRKAKLESMKAGHRTACDDMLQSALLYHGVCQLAELMGLCSYEEFEREIRRLTGRPQPGDPEKSNLP
jgi:hypothetical protein